MYSPRTSQQTATHRSSPTLTSVSAASNLHPMHPLRSPSQSSSVSYTSTANLVPHDSSNRGKPSWARRVFSCSKRKRKVHDSEKNGGLAASQSGDRRMTLFQGWKVIFFGSWLNVLILLIPATWILRLATPDSHTLIFCSCLLALIPLVKMHDLSVSELSVRLGGSRTGLLNASMSNIVESVIAVIALRKCELRVVQSSLIGSMLSKLLLILGMCFFAGGMRFTQQDLDCTATQIHSSLLSLSVGAVLLPAAFHFTLTYRSGESIGASIDDQKKDILRMSHGVSVVLLFIYFSYLLFQFWSHSHHFEDVPAPSDRLPNAVSVRSMASRVRPPSPLRNITSPTPTYTTEFRSPGLTSPEARKGPYAIYQMDTKFSSPPRGGGILMGGGRSSFTNASQVTLATPPAAASTVRLVSEAEREDSGLSSGSGSSGSSGSGSPSGSWGVNHAGERASLVSELVSSYLTDMGLPADRDEHSVPNPDFRSRVTLVENSTPLRESKDHTKSKKKEPELSWFLTLVLLTVVTVLVAVNSEWMIDSIDGLSPTISKEWIGLILLPAVGSLAECITSMNVSVKDQLTLSVSVAVGSTIQTALFVIPFMVLLGWAIDKPLALLFDPFESIVLYISVHTMNYVVADGKSNWLEGIILIGLYIVAAVTFWFYPGSNFSTNLAVCDTSVF